MKRRGFFMALGAALGLYTRDAAGWTEVKHGSNAVFDAPLTGGTFTCTVVGRYTKIQNCGAGGVTGYRFKSKDPEQQNGELLILRTAFLEWFRETFEKNGGSRQRAVAEVCGVAQGWLQPGYSPEALCPDARPRK
jgi:hypothetical protein